MPATSAAANALVSSLARRQQLQGGGEGERAVVPGRARILQSVGDECNALILVTVERISVVAPRRHCRLRGSIC
jgi:hypothetical protein